jgi:hypothetical protein
MSSAARLVEALVSLDTTSNVLMAAESRRTLASRFYYQFAVRNLREILLGMRFTLEDSRAYGLSN